jgi:hypothetical protein
MRARWTQSCWSPGGAPTAWTGSGRRPPTPTGRRVRPGASLSAGVSLPGRRSRRRARKGAAARGGRRPMISTAQHGNDLITVRFASRRVPGVSQSAPVPAGALSDADAPPAGPVLGPAGRPAPRTPPRLHGALRPAGWGGRPSVARHARLRVASRPLHRASEKPSSAPAHCGGAELRARGTLVNRYSSRKNPAIALCRVAGASRLMGYLAAICQQYQT